MDVEIKRDGLTLRGTLVKPQTEEFNLVVLMHGFTSNRGVDPDQLLYQLAQRFEAEGMATLRFDFNGHGQSDGRFQDMTVLNESVMVKPFWIMLVVLRVLRSCIFWDILKVELLLV